MRRFDSVKHRFLLILSICLFGMLLLVANQMYHTSRLIELNQHNQLLLRLSNDLLQLRRHEKDFMLRQHDIYLEKFRDRAKLFVNDLEALLPVLENHHLPGAMATDISNRFNKYEQMFFQLADLQIKLGLDEDSGEKGKFRRAAHQLEEQFDTLGKAQWQVALLQLRRHEKDFMLRKRNEYVQKAQRVYDELRADISNSNNATKDELLTFLDEYMAGLTTLNQSFQTIGLTHEDGLQGKFRTQTHSVEDSLFQIDSRLSPVIRLEEQRVRSNGLIIMALTSAILVFLIIRSFTTFQRTLRAFLHFFQHSKDQLTQLDPNSISFSEFKNMANLANEMVQARDAAERKLHDTKDQLASVNNSLEKRVEDSITEIRSLNEEIESTQKEVVFTMGAIGETRSQETGNHVRRVAEYSKLLALKAGLPEAEAELLKQASPMHDIGKVAIPDAILNKPGALTDKEMEVMKRHAQIGYEMLCHSERPILKTAAIVAGQHHEKWDGTGYPKGLAGQDIHIYGRITMLADVFDALGSRRCYKEPWSDEDIFRYLREQSGKMFDPNLVKLFFDNLELFFDIRERYQDDQIKAPYESDTLQINEEDETTHVA